MNRLDLEAESVSMAYDRYVEQSIEDLQTASEGMQERDWQRTLLLNVLRVRAGLATVCITCGGAGRYWAHQLARRPLRLRRRRL